MERNGKSDGLPSDRPVTSRVLSEVDTLTTRPVAGISAAVVVVATWIVIIVTGLDDDLQLAFATVCSGVTVTMVFVIQQSQNKDTVALHLKLNELIAATG